MKTKHAHTNGRTVKHTDKDYSFVRSDPFQHTRKCSMALKLNCKNIEKIIFCLNRSKSIVISLVRGIIIFYLTSLRFLRSNLTKKKISTHRNTVKCIVCEKMFALNFSNESRSHLTSKQCAMHAKKSKKKTNFYCFTLLQLI